MHLPPPPDARELLPPLLACLPTAFISPRPPPALLPLLSPLLRQRVAFLGVSGSNDGTNSGWLPLLSWDASRAAKLPAIVERIELEPHPVSGEVEIEDVRPAKYRRLDVETLQARLEVEQFELLPLFVWCESDEHAGGDGSGAGWKLAELRASDDADEDATEWFEDIVEADEAASATSGRSLAVPQINGGRQSGAQSGNEEEDDDDYWASYDRTPGRGPTPAKQSPAPSTQAAVRGRSQSELDYYSRYGAEVQPALDAHDPDEENEGLGESTLNGDSLVRQQAQQAQHQDDRPISRPNGASMFPADNGTSKPHDSLLASATEQSAYSSVEQPRPISPTESQTSVERLEQRAAAISEDADRAHTAIKQHISTDIKSLFRLAKSTGMERREFERIVKTELECLGFLEENEE